MTSIINEFLPANSASPTIIAKGFYEGTPAYYKIFYNGENKAKRDEYTEALLYESEIYKYISNQDDESIKQFFVNFLYSDDTTLRKLYSDGLIADLQDNILIDRMKETGIMYDSIIHVIITENTDSETLFDYLDRQTDTYNNDNYMLLSKKMSNIFDIVLQGIYVLNNKLEIQHNDMHFGNILIKNKPYMYKMDFLGVYGYLKSSYKISIFDFDRAYLKGHPNPLLTSLCNIGGGCNTISYKDIFVFIQSIIYLYLKIQYKSEYTLQKNI